jgi:hypothetical protein
MAKIASLKLLAFTVAGSSAASFYFTGSGVAIRSLPLAVLTQGGTNEARKRPNNFHHIPVNLLLAVKLLSVGDGAVAKLSRCDSGLLYQSRR